MIKWFLEKYKTNLRFRQVLTLYSVNVIGIPLSIVTSVVMTKFLGPSGFGDYKFFFSLINLVIILITFGFIQAGNRALVLNHSREEAREYYGAELVILLFMYFLMALILMIYAFVDHNIKSKGLDQLLLYLIPFSWVFLLIQYFETLFQADNKISLLAKSRIFPQIVLFITAVFIYYVLFKFEGDKLKLVFTISLSLQIAVFLYIIYKVNPSFCNLRLRLSEIVSYNKSYGFNVYIGSVLSLGFNELTGVLISYFGADNAGVGYYALALTITMPLSFIPNVIATTHYKDFSTRLRIPKRLFLVTVFLSSFTIIMLWILVGPFIHYFYGHNFDTVINLTLVASIGVIFHGFGDFLNRFLGSHGQGKALRNSAIIVGFSLMTLNVILIPFYGEKGAAVTRALSGIIYVSCMFWFYKRLVNTLEREGIKDNPQ